MLRAIIEFASKLKSAGSNAVGFLYYSGHGIAAAGENYLIPVDVDEPSTSELSVQGVKQSEVLAILRGEAPNAAHYLVLDACRHSLRGARGGIGYNGKGDFDRAVPAGCTDPCWPGLFPTHRWLGSLVQNKKPRRTGADFQAFLAATNGITFAAFFAAGFRGPSRFFGFRRFVLAGTCLWTSAAINSFRASRSSAATNGNIN
jgi:Caspase domain